MSYTPRVHATDLLKSQKHKINKKLTDTSFIYVHRHLFIDNEEKIRKELGSTLKENSVFEISAQECLLLFCFPTIL
jgi:hypothetical protein